ncbi:MAG: hypothetical protein ACYC1Q_03425, partial [Bacteroidia bacterium]
APVQEREKLFGEGTEQLQGLFFVVTFLKQAGAPPACTSSSANSVRVCFFVANFLKQAGAPTCLHILFREQLQGLFFVVTFLKQAGAPTCLQLLPLNGFLSFQFRLNQQEKLTIQ